MLSFSDTGGNGHLFIAEGHQFVELRSEIAQKLLDTKPQNQGKWQQLDVSASAGHDTYELLNVSLWYQMQQSDAHAANDILPDLPWAEAHFQERVGGRAINPGVEHANWPYHANGAELHLKNKKYDHNYMERFWPKDLKYDNFWTSHAGLPFEGYRFPVGDLNDVVQQLIDNSGTRQAYLPIFFPEDTGATSDQRVPCTLGYHFIIRNGEINLQYNMRSCEIYRHFTNDVYMAVRLAQWVRDRIVAWGGPMYSLGQLSLHAVSLHGFVGDTDKIEGFIQ
jgi:hypothetical protein